MSDERDSRQPAGSSQDTVIFRKALLDEILPLREAVIIAGTNRPSEYPGDRDDTTFHIGGFARGENVCCGTFLLTDWFGEPAYQLRGMATREDMRGEGIGAALLAATERFILNSTPLRQLWCSARVSAVGFYQKIGWSVVSDVYDVPNVGPHRKMCKRIIETNSSSADVSERLQDGSC